MSTAESVAPVLVGEWLVEPALDSISRAGETQKLEPRTMRLLLCLVASAGSVVSVDTLLNEVWSGVVVGSASVYQAVSQLRKILGDTDPQATYIATVPRKGYRLIAAVRPATSAPTSIPDLKEPLDLHPGTARTESQSPARRYWILGLCSFVVVAATFLGWHLTHKSAADGARASIVVLRFVDMTADKKDQPFCDGLTEELSNWLAQIPDLRVVARTSAFSFSGRAEDVRKIGRELGTNHVLEGSMRRSGESMRVTVQLIDATNGYHLWSANYDRLVADAIKVQEDIARSVAQTLQIRLTADTSQRFAARRSSNSQAYASYLLARHYQQERTARSNDQAIQLFKQVVAQDPKFSLAYVGLAYALLNQNFLADRSINEIAAEAEPLLNTARRLDPKLSDIYAVRGALRAEQFRNTEALADLHHAVALNPSDSVAFTELGRLYLLNQGKPRDALNYYSQAATLDPLNYLPQTQRCLSLQDLARYEDATLACARARELLPKGYWPLVVTSWLMSAQGKLDEALKWNHSALEVAPDVYDLYRDCATWNLILGIPARARETLELARIKTQEEGAINVELAEVAYYEGGPMALKKHMETTRMEDTADSGKLFQAAYYRLLMDEPAAATALIKRGLAASDFTAESLDNPDAARWGHSDQLLIAMVELQSGETASAMKRLDAVASTLDKLVQAGERGYGVDELRATVLALRGDAAGAMQSLTHAADLGWRRSWWAEREPDVATLLTRTDFRALMERVNRSNDEMRARVLQQRGL
jgi:TolB-like protein/DNA-binding winged helix-turn-helix (wHTH) protein